ncbi:MAG: hypothetical protein ACOYKA_03235 [Legionellaceae bacterium]
MHEKSNIPVFVSVVLVLLGCYDLIRGFMHTFLLNYSALNIAGLNLTTLQASDLLRLLGAFGVSNFLTGIMFMMIACTSRKLSLAMLGIIPSVYFIGYLTIHASTKLYPHTQALWLGLTPLLVYMCVCLATFMLGLGVVVYRRNA